MTGDIRLSNAVMNQRQKKLKFESPNEVTMLVLTVHKDIPHINPPNYIPVHWLPFLFVVYKRNKKGRQCQCFFSSVYHFLSF